MRRRVKVWLCALCCANPWIGAASAAETPPLEQVVARHLEARGGAERWREIDAIELRGVYAAFSEHEPFTLIRARGDLYRLDFTILRSPAVRARDADGPWWLHPLLQPQPGRLEEGPYRSQLERESLFGPLLLDYAERGIAVELVGPAEVEGIPVIELSVTLPDGSRESWFLDSDSYLEVAVDSRVTDFTQSTEPIVQRAFYDDFREVEGVWMPFRLDYEFGHRLESMRVEEAAIDGAFDRARFSPPPMEPAQRDAAEVEAAIEEALGLRARLEELMEGLSTEARAELDQRWHQRQAAAEPPPAVAAPEPSAPGEAAAPEPSRQPEASPEPGASQQAAASPEPGADRQAGASPKPGASQQAAASPEPGANRQAGATAEPGASRHAAASPEPGADRQAEATPEPGASQQAAASPEPGARGASRQPPADRAPEPAQPAAAAPAAEAAGSPPSADRAMPAEPPPHSCGTLTVFDSDGDGSVSGSDRFWRYLGLWIDDGDGALEEREVDSLFERGIRRVSARLYGYTTVKDVDGGIWVEERIYFDLPGRGRRSRGALTVDAGGLARSDDTWLEDRAGHRLDGLVAVDGETVVATAPGERHPLLCR